MTAMTPWVDPESIVCQAASGTYTELWEEMVLQAAWMLDTLTGGVLHGEQCWVEDYRVRNTCEITLLRGPVDEILSVEKVHRCGVEDPTPMTWCPVSQNRISICCSGVAIQHYVSCGCSEEVVRVTYRIASNLPPGTEGKVGWLAGEMLLAYQGSGACQLPERITSVSRQGVSWTLLDPQDYLDKGYLGVPQIDAWLMAARRSNPTTKVFDPLRSQRVYSEEIVCPTVTP